jgi:hypothetical protein
MNNEKNNNYNFIILLLIHLYWTMNNFIFFIIFSRIFGNEKKLV